MEKEGEGGAGGENQPHLGRDASELPKPAYSLTRAHPAYVHTPPKCLYEFIKYF